MDLRITGLEQVQRALKEMPARIVVTGYAKALNNAAGVIAAEVASRAEQLPESGSDTPLHEHVRVQVAVDANQKGGIATVGFDSTPDERTGKPQDFKALLIEAGHTMLTHHQTAPGSGIQHVPARPFVRPAFDAASDRAIEVFQETLIDSLSQGNPE